MKTKSLEFITRLFVNAGIYIGLLVLYIHWRGIEVTTLSSTLQIIIGISERLLLPITIGGYFVFASILGKSEFKLNYWLLFTLLIVTVSVFEYSFTN